MDNNKLITEYNNITIEFLNQAVNLCSKMDNDAVKLIDVVKLQNILEFENEFAIQFFLRYGIKYKNQIDIYDYSVIDKFDPKNIEIKLTSVSTINKYFAFSKLWKKLNTDNKKIFFDYLQIMCNIALKYAEKTIINNKPNSPIDKCIN